MNRILLAVLCAANCGVAAEPNPAPEPSTGRSASSAQTAGKSGDIAVTGSFRSRGEIWDWFRADSGDGTYGYAGNLLRVSFSQNRERWEWNAEIAVTALLGLPANAVASGVQGALGVGANYLIANGRNRNPAMVFPKQLYVRFPGFGGGKAHTLKLGRFEFFDGAEVTPRSATLAALKQARVNQRLLGNFGFTHVGRSFDGLHYSYSPRGGVFTFVSGVPTRGVFQVDGWGWHRTAVGYASYVRPWGTGGHGAETRIFALLYDDWRKAPKTDNRPAAVRGADQANIRLATFGGHTLHAHAREAGTADVLLWGAVQTGRWGLQGHRGAAFDLEGGFQPHLPWKPWIRAGFFWSSGDSNPADGLHETFFQVLPTPRPFARFPFFNMMNNQDVFGMLLLRPQAKITLSTEFHALRLSAPGDLWYQGGGAFHPWTFGYSGRPTSGRSSLANLYDLNLEYRMGPKLTLVGYLGWAQGLAAASAIYPAGKDARFGYLEALYRF